MIKYPEYIPQFLQYGTSFTTVNPLLRTEMVSGRSKQRRRYKTVPTFADITTLPMTSAQAQTFEAWFENDLESGSKWFEGPIRTPLGSGHIGMRFVGIYDGPIPVNLDYWRFTARVELMRRQIIPSEWASGAPDFIQKSNMFDILMNSTWPAA